MRILLLYFCFCNLSGHLISKVISLDIFFFYRVGWHLVLVYPSLTKITVNHKVILDDKVMQNCKVIVTMSYYYIKSN